MNWSKGWRDTWWYRAAARILSWNPGDPERLHFHTERLGIPCQCVQPPLVKIALCYHRQVHEFARGLSDELDHWGEPRLTPEQEQQERRYATHALRSANAEARAAGFTWAQLRDALHHTRPWNTVRQHHALLDR